MTTDTSVDVMAVLDVIDHCAKIIGETGYPHSEAALNKAREAIRELVEADREHDEANASYATAATGKPRNDAWARVLAARQRRAAALQKFAGV